MKEIVLDTETTGISIKDGHRIVEIGCIELENLVPTQNKFHCFLNQERKVSEKALEVHGYTDDFLANQKKFKDIGEQFLEFIKDKRLIIHNADFDIGFLDHELKRVREPRKMRQRCGVIDSLSLARMRYPGQKNSLDALCKRLGVDNSGRTLHGALLDAQILAEVYLVLTGGQGSLSLDATSADQASADVRATGGFERPQSGVPLVT